jgi:hypothetical protein
VQAQLLDELDPGDAAGSGAALDLDRAGRLIGERLPPVAR